MKTRSLLKLSVLFLLALSLLTGTVGAKMAEAQFIPYPPFWPPPHIFRNSSPDFGDLIEGKNSPEDKEMVLARGTRFEGDSTRLRESY